MDLKSDIESVITLIIIISWTDRVEVLRRIATRIIRKLVHTSFVIVEFSTRRSIEGVLSSITSADMKTTKQLYKTFHLILIQADAILSYVWKNSDASACHISHVRTSGLILIVCRRSPYAAVASCIDDYFYDTDASRWTFFQFWSSNVMYYKMDYEVIRDRCW